MKKLNAVLIGILCLSTLGLIAQPQRNAQANKENYHAQKVAYITDIMELTPEEAGAFWPLYNESVSKKKELQVSVGEYRLNLNSRFSELTEEEAKEALEVFQSHMKNMNALTIEYQNKYLEVVPAKKVLLLLKAEKDFRRLMLKKLGNRKRGNF